MKQWNVGDRFCSGVFYFEIVKVLNQPMGLGDFYLVEYNDGDQITLGPNLDSFEYLGNFSKSQSFKNLYEKLL